VTGFIRVYAGYLGLDSDALLAQLEDDLPIGTGTSAVKYIPVAKHKPGRSRKTVSRQGRGTLLWATLAILLIGAAIYFLPGYFHSQPSVVGAPEQHEPAGATAPEPAAPVASTVSPETGTATPSNLQPGNVETSPASPPVEVRAEAESAAQVEGGPGPLDVPREEQSAPGETEGISPAAAGSPDQATPSAAPPEPKQYPPIAPGGSSLRMLAVAKSSLVIYLDGPTPHNYKLVNGLDLTWKIKRKVRIEMASPGVARFWLDGQELDLDDQSAFQLQASSGE
jgi:cytoskeletal protein RodZ